MSALSVRDIGISFGGVKAVDTVSFDVEEGAIFSIIGPNGAGKTTLFNLISGVYVPMTGSVSLFGETVTALEPDRLVARGLSRTFQNLQIFFRMTVAENVMEEDLQVKVHWQGKVNNRYFAVKTRTDPDVAMQEDRRLAREEKKRRKARLSKKRRKK